MRHSLTHSLTHSVAGVLTAVAFAAPAEAQLKLVELMGALDTPSFVTSFPGNPDLMVACERATARIRSWIGTPVPSSPPSPPAPQPVMTVVLDLVANPGSGPAPYIPTVTNSDQSGLTGLAYHPRFEGGRAWRFMYVRFNRLNAANDQQMVVRRYAVPMGTTVANPQSAVDVLIYTFADAPSDTHVSGTLHFDPRPTPSGNDYRYLYIPMPDGCYGTAACLCGGVGGVRGQNMERVQDDNFFVGKLLRIEVGPAAVPVVGQPTIVAKGLRNPWGTSVDQGDPNNGIGAGEIWVCDTGSNTAGEIHFLPSTNLPACPGPQCTYFGWPFRRGLPGTNILQDAHCLTMPPPQGNPCASPPTLPFLPQEQFYSIQNQPYHAPQPPPGHGVLISGRIYRGALAPWLTGRFVYATVTQGTPSVDVYSFLPALGVPRPPTSPEINGERHTNDLGIGGVGATFFQGAEELHNLCTDCDGELLLICVNPAGSSPLLQNGKILRILPD